MSTNNKKWICNQCTFENVNTMNSLKCSLCELQHYTIQLNYPSGEAIFSIISSMSTIDEIKNICFKNNDIRRQLTNMYSLDNGENVLLDNHIISLLMNNNRDINKTIILYALERSDPLLNIPKYELDIVCNFLNMYTEIENHITSANKKQLHHLLNTFINNDGTTSLEYIDNISILDKYFSNTTTNNVAIIFCRILCKLLSLSIETSFLWFSAYSITVYLDLYISNCIEIAKSIALDEILESPIPMFSKKNPFIMYHVWCNNNTDTSTYKYLNNKSIELQIVREITYDEFIKIDTTLNENGTRNWKSITPEINKYFPNII